MICCTNTIHLVTVEDIQIVVSMAYERGKSQRMLDADYIQRTAIPDISLDLFLILSFSPLFL